MSSRVKKCNMRILAFILSLTTFIFTGLIPTVRAEGLTQTIVNSKTRSTYYTPERVAAARQNIEKYDWAKSERDAALAEADKYVNLGIDYLWNLVSSQSIPRSYSYCVQGSKQTFRCLNCGEEIKASGNYPFLADPINSPWKIECPKCHLKFPTNDFEAYYKSGLDEHGNFNSMLANKGLLKNTLYPEKGVQWGVDDGNGYVDASGYKYTFIAYYNHWILWYGKTTSSAIIEGSLNSLRDAYIYTGDIKYARAGTILLDRIADVYPSMNLSAYPNTKGFLNSDGGNGGVGKVVGSIWETGLAKDFIKAYDAFFSAIDDPEIIGFLSSKADKYNLGDLKKSAAGIRKNIEDGIIRQIYPAVKNAQIRGNNGMHQSTLALAAVILDKMPETKEWLDFDFQAGSFLQSPLRVTGGNILATLVNDVDRDGDGNEAAPGYNRLWLSQYLEVANILDGYDLYPAADLYKNVKFKKMFTAMYPLMLSDIYTANIGDSSNAGNPANYVNKAEIIRAFEKYGDPIFAQVVYKLNGNSVEGIHSDIFSSDPDRVANDIKTVIDSYGQLDLKSTNLTGYGFTALRGMGNDGTAQRDIWMYYGRNTGHGHKDTLNIGIHAFKLDLSPDLGYPEAADALNAHRFEWMSNTISHNTVVVDNTKQGNQWVSQPKHFDDSDMVKLTDIEAPGVYTQTQEYRRTNALIKVDNENSYSIDFFRVKGGSDHNFSFHGAEGAVSTEGLNFIPQTTGTYAGPDIAFPGTNYKYTGASNYTGSGYQWLKNVSRDNNPSNNFSVDWNVKDTWNVYGNGAKADTDVHLRLTMLGNVGDVAIADGVPSQNKLGNPTSLKYVVAHRSGTNLNSLFTSVIEPYKAERFISSIEPAVLKANGQIVDCDDAKAVKVTLKDGRVDYIVYSLDSSVTYTVNDKFQFKGFFGLYSEKGGNPVNVYSNDAEIVSNIISGTQAKYTGTIVSFTKDMNINNEITIQLNQKDFNPTDLIGRFIYVQNDGARNAVYEIKGIKSINGSTITLDIGDKTTIRNWADVNDFSKGYIYDISGGAQFTIPLSIDKSIYLEKVDVVLSQDTLTRGQTAGLSVTGKLNTGAVADLTTAAIEYSSSNPDVASVHDGVVTACNAGSADITVKVTLNGVTVSSVVTVKVYVSINSIRSLINIYKASGELTGSLVPQLENNLSQAEQKLSKGDKAQASKHMNDFIKHLDNMALSKDISDVVKNILESDANALISSLK